MTSLMDDKNKANSSGFLPGVIMNFKSANGEQRSVILKVLELSRVTQEQLSQPFPVAIYHQGLPLPPLPDQFALIASNLGAKSKGEKRR